MEYMEQRAFVIDDGVLWLFPSSVVTDSVCVVQTADGFLYQIILIGRTFSVWGSETEVKIVYFADGSWQEWKRQTLRLCELVVK